MSTAEVSHPPTGPNLQDPTSGHSELIPELGPDGRGDDVGVIDQEQPPETDTQENEAENNTEQDIEENTEQNTTIDVKFEEKETQPKQVEMETTEQVQSNTSTKKLPDNSKSETTEKDSLLENENRENVIDIVKQSKLAESSVDLGDLPEFPQSRPLTETTNRDGTRMSYETEKERKDGKSDLDRDTKTPFSVVVERKPLHTAQTRSHSDYYSKTPSTSRYTYIAASLSQFSGGFHHDYRGLRNQHRQAQIQRTRRPPKLVRLATVTMSPKTKPIPRGPSLYYEEPKKPSKTITWDEANDARPPLRIDMEGPGPTQYSPRNKPLNETNSPAWTFGSKCYIEKSGGSRTSWEKTWFQNPSVWTSKVDFYNDSGWPSPTHYRQKPMLGPRQRTVAEAPSFTIGTRKEMLLNKRGSDKEPSPLDYDKDMADKVTLKNSPAYTHQFRREGTILWSGNKDRVPGPGSYTPKYSYNKPHGPAFTIRSLRREKSHVLGPFSTM